MEELDERALEAAVNAFYEAQIRSVADVIEKLEFELSDLPQLFDKLRKESETAQILIFSSYLEDKIENLIRLQLREGRSSNDDEKLFGGTGPLSTFSNRILMTHQLGWLRDKTRARLDLFRKIRNDFAHAAYRLSFDDHKIASWFVGLRGDLTPMFQIQRQVLERHNVPVPDFDNLDRNVKYLCWLAMLAHDVCVDLLVMPKALVFQVNPGDVIGKKYDAAPKALKSLTKALVRTLLHLTRDESPSSI